MLKVYVLALLSVFGLSMKAQTIPGFTIVSQNSVACTDAPLTFSAITNAGTGSFTWSVSPAKYADISDSHAAVVDITFSKDLTFTVNVVASENGTTASKNKIITAYKTAHASFNASLNTAGYPVLMQLTNYSTGTIKNYWNYSDDIAKDSAFSTSKAYQKSGNYTITLQAVGQKGCNDQLAYSFRIPDSSSVVLPNVFTPNRDEINDIYKPITTGLTELHAYVYDRDGVLVHSWHQVNAFWDGRTTSGEVCQDGTYFIVLNAKGFDGRSYKMKGNIMLIR